MINFFRKLLQLLLYQLFNKQFYCIGTFNLNLKKTMDEDSGNFRPLLSTSQNAENNNNNNHGPNSYHMSLVHSIGLATVTPVEPAKRGITISKARKRIYITCFLVLVFLGACLFSVVAPFFPTRAMEKGMSQTVTGLVIGSMQLMQFFVAIILGKWIVKRNRL